jgi:hypothetical protein
MRRLRLFLTGLVFASGALASPIGAQQMPPTATRMPCHNATEIAKQLNSRYDESPVAFGLQSNGNLLQVYASEEKGTWTVVSTTPNGLSCIVAAGKTWESLPPTKTDPLA